MAEPELYSLKEVAALVKVSVWTLHQWIRQGKLKAHKVGRDWRVRKEEVARLLGRE